jgi:hypothetical protein
MPTPHFPIYNNHTTAVIGEAVTVTPLLIWIPKDSQHGGDLSLCQGIVFTYRSHQSSKWPIQLIQLWCAVSWAHDDFPSYWWKFYNHLNPYQCEEPWASNWKISMSVLGTRVYSLELTNSPSHISTPMQVSKVLMSAPPIGTDFWPIILLIDLGK